MNGTARNEESRPGLSTYLRNSSVIGERSLHHHHPTRRLDHLRRIQVLGNTDKRMLSFNITILFTNVPLTFTIELILGWLYLARVTNCTDKPRIRRSKDCYHRDEFRILLDAATLNTSFMFDGKIFVPKL